MRHASRKNQNLPGSQHDCLDILLAQYTAPLLTCLPPTCYTIEFISNSIYLVYLVYISHTVFNSHGYMLTGGSRSAALMGLFDDGPGLTGEMDKTYNNMLDSPWKGAEAFHFFLLAQRQLYEGM